MAEISPVPIQTPVEPAVLPAAKDEMVTLPVNRVRAPDDKPGVKFQNEHQSRGATRGTRTAQSAGTAPEAPARQQRPAFVVHLSEAVKAQQQVGTTAVLTKPATDVQVQVEGKKEAKKEKRVNRDEGKGSEMHEMHEMQKDISLTSTKANLATRRAVAQYQRFAAFG